MKNFSTAVLIMALPLTAGGQTTMDKLRRDSGNAQTFVPPAKVNTDLPSILLQPVHGSTHFYIEISFKGTGIKDEQATLKRLKEWGITVTKGPGAENVPLRAFDHMESYDGHTVGTFDPQNSKTIINDGDESLLQDGWGDCPNGVCAPISYTLNFNRPYKSITLTRTAIKGGMDSGVNHPAWYAEALDDAGNVIPQPKHKDMHGNLVDGVDDRKNCVGESLADRPHFTNDAAMPYTLVGAPGGSGIRAVRVTSNGLDENHRPKSALPSAVINSILLELQIDY